MSQLYPPEFEGVKAAPSTPVTPFGPPLWALGIVHVAGWAVVIGDNHYDRAALRIAGLSALVLSGATVAVLVVATLRGVLRLAVFLALLATTVLLASLSGPDLLTVSVAVTVIGCVAMLPVWLLQIVFGWEFRWREPRDDEGLASLPSLERDAHGERERQFQLWHLFVVMAIVALICCALRMLFGERMGDGLMQLGGMLLGLGIVMLPSIVLAISILRLRDAWVWSLFSFPILLVLGLVAPVAILAMFSRRLDVPWGFMGGYLLVLLAIAGSLALLRTGGVVFAPRRVD